MTNALRNQYLQKLGIVQYVSKDLPLEAAAPAILGGTEIIDQPVASQTNTNEVQKKSMAELVNLSLEKNTELTPAIQAVSAATESNNDIELKFALWQVSETLLVCSAIEETLPDPQQILLLGNILIAMGQTVGQLPQMELVEWPPHPNMQGDEAEVREFLATLIKARIDSKQTEIVLLMGDAAAQWLLTDQQKAAVTNGQVDIIEQVTALLVPSLQAMIDRPECKRQTWQTIRYLSPLRHVHKTQS